MSSVSKFYRGYIDRGLKCVEAEIAGGAAGNIGMYIILKMGGRVTERRKRESAREREGGSEGRQRLCVFQSVSKRGGGVYV